VSAVLLRIAARVEAASLLILLVNLATVHVPPVAALIGPVHGCAYLFVIGATLQVSRDRRTRLLALVPGVGGLLADRAVTAARTSGSRMSGSRTSGSRTSGNQPGGR
jgi:hypothetical protein